MEVTWIGQCDVGPIQVKIGPANWGYLSQPIDGIQALGGSASTTLCVQPNATSLGTGDSGLSAPGYWKCFNFTQVWIEISGNTPDSGLYKIDVPAYVEARDCPPGASSNDPSRVWNPTEDFPSPSSTAQPPETTQAPETSTSPSPDSSGSANTTTG